MAVRVRAKWFRQPQGLTEEAQRLWFLHGPACIEAELLWQGNAETFAQMCQLLAAMRSATAEIARDGVTVTSPSGMRKSNPAVASLISLQKAAEPLMRRFGMDG